VQVIGEKGEKFMKKQKIKYTDEPIGKIKIVDDFLPKPKDLVLKEETEKITIALTKSSIDFFKKEAAKHHARYQTMIRAVIDRYASHYHSSP
jgi:predicted DNA binding CopG/RHH family protein